MMYIQSQRSLAVVLPAVVVTVGLVGWGWAFFAKHPRREGALAVPRASGHWPLLGRIAIVQNARKGKAHHEFERIIDDADSTLVRIHVLGQMLLSATCPESAEALLRKSKFVPKLDRAYDAFSFLGMGRDSLITAGKEEHTRLRQAFGNFFSSENITAVLSQLTEEISSVCDSTAMSATDSNDRSAHVNMLDISVSIIDSVVRKVFFQSAELLDMAALHDAFAHAGETALNTRLRRAVKSGWAPGAQRFRDNYESLRDSWQRLAQEAYSRPLHDKDTAFWACLRRAYPDAPKNEAEWEAVLSNTGLMYGAGSETTANAIAMTLVALSLDNVSLACLEEELDNAGLLVTKVRRDPRLPNSDDLKTLQFLNAVFHESLRFFPPAAFATARRLDRDAHIAGYDLPAGTAVNVPTWAIHRSCKVWGADAKRWRPDRWLEGRSINAIKKSASGALRWIPFSDGGQNCIGQHLATIETKLAVAIFVSRFQLSRDARMEADSPEAFAAACTSLVTLAPRSGAWVQLTPR